MIEYIKTYWKTILFFGLAGLFGGFFTGVYLLDSYPAETRQQLIMQLAMKGIDSVTPEVFIGIITAVQAAGFGLALGFLGIMLSKKTELWDDERKLEKKPLIAAAIVSVLGGLLMLLPDIFFFSNYSDAIKASYESKPTIMNMLASVTYGAVIEEVMMRLFAMSLIVFLLEKIFDRSHALSKNAILILANALSALLFGLLHIPANALMLGGSSMIIARCILLNGGLGLLFGDLYRKFGIRYAMIAHGGCHIVCKLIWMLFI